MSSRAQLPQVISDEEITRRFQESGDGDWFAELFSRHRKRVFCACRGFFDDGGAAEDATQETFLRAYQNMHRFHGGDFCGWLMRIAKNVCIDAWRKRRPEAGGEQVETYEMAAGGTVEEASDLRFAVEKLRQELGALSPGQRQCLEMKIDGYSYEEMAARTGLSIESVKSHLQNGRRALWLRMEGMLSQLK